MPTGPYSKNPLTIVKTGSTPTPTPTPEPLDPKEVYEETRPADWLVMPEPENEEYFLLLEVGDNLVDNHQVAITMSNARDWTLELGILTLRVYLLPTQT